MKLTPAFYYDFNDIHGVVGATEDMAKAVKPGDLICLYSDDLDPDQAWVHLVRVVDAYESPHVPGKWLIKTDHLSLRKSDADATG